MEGRGLYRISQISEFDRIGPLIDATGLVCMLQSTIKWSQD